MSKIDNTPTTDASQYKNKWIVGSIHKQTGAVSFSTNPMRHDDKPSAKKEAARLAELNPSKNFIVVCITDIASWGVSFL